MTETSEFAPAKINLTLEVLGRRPDGFHEIRSLVAFAANAGDRLTALRERDGRVQVSGPFAGHIAGTNLVATALNAVRALAPTAPMPSVRLDKNLPVASGMGGGSADAAAVLRLISRSAVTLSDANLRSIAARLGSDVSVCLLGNAAFMTGRGESVEVSRLPSEIYAVLANPMIRVPINKTAQVFAKLKAPPLRKPPTQDSAGMVFFTVPDLVAYIEKRRNALEKPALDLFPAISRVIAELSSLQGSLLAQLSGAGPTCFALFNVAREAMSGAEQLSQRHPDWWVKATRLV